MAAPCESEPDFSQPWKVSDIVLLVDDVRLHVHSGVLVMWSPVFENMFAELKRKNARVLTLEKQKPNEIRELLLVIYPTIKRPINENNCYYLLEIAEQFQMRKVTEQCEEYLMRTLKSGSELVDLLVLASKYNMRILREECLKLTKQLEWKVIQQHNLYEQIELKDYREIAEERLRSLHNDHQSEKEKAFRLEEELDYYRRQGELARTPSSCVVNPGLASPRLPRKQIVQPCKSRPVQVVLNTRIKPAVQSPEKSPHVPPPVPKRAHFPVKPQPIIKEF
ncbi:ring canal kelch protein-like [Actinia tenebrosa]|uniref:Ring canal kelch protein-like n=1 Tax=Actinia tenebrosa TaxID=6105 RepID=A0A6P8HZQ6_ACTTE|nr:ring canal kelch protein-like [Actinia tenebrosa]